MVVFAKPSLATLPVVHVLGAGFLPWSDRRPVHVPGNGILRRVMELAVCAIHAASCPSIINADGLSRSHRVEYPKVNEGRVVKLARYAVAALPCALIEGAHGLSGALGQFNRRRRDNAAQERRNWGSNWKSSLGWHRTRRGGTIDVRIRSGISLVVRAGEV